VSSRRHLDWNGCFNARDLGGLRTAGGHVLRRGAVVRADALDELDAGAWAALRALGIRTVIDLRNDDERGSVATPPAGLATLHLPLDNIEDRSFWDEWSSGWQFGTPLYYGPHIARFPERSAGVIAAIARAAPGGVVFHCGIGRDRTGLVAMLLLSVLGVSPEDIAEDHVLSGARLGPLFAKRGEPDQGPIIEAFLTGRGTSARQIIVETLASFDRERWMREGGIDETDLEALRRRLLG
jgi:protein-tyrosine phosphatase